MHAFNPKTTGTQAADLDGGRIMRKYVLGLFDRREDADAAVGALNQRNLPETDFGLFARHEPLREGLGADDEKSGTAKGAAYGAAFGGASGVLVGTVAGASLFLVPGIGQMLGIGALAAAIGTALIGTGLGAAGGAFMGALIGYGATEEDAHFYMEGMQRGGVLLVVHTVESNVVEVAQIMEENNVANVEARRQEWKAQGWESHEEHVEMDDRPPLK
jgi:hypothetical protein